MRLTSLFALAAAVTSCLADATPLVNALNQQIVPQLNVIAKDVNAFPGSGLNGSLTLDNDVDTLATLLDNASSAAQSAGTFTIIETLDLATALGPIVSTTVATLTELVKKQADFNSIGRTPFVLANLQILNIRTSEFATIVLSNVPVGQAEALNALKTQLDTALDTAIKAFSAAQ